MIQVDNLTRYYGERRAVDAASFSIGANEVVGFLGLNGAGKTTTIQLWFLGIESRAMESTWHVPVLNFAAPEYFL